MNIGRNDLLEVAENAAINSAAVENKSHYKDVYRYCVLNSGWGSRSGCDAEMKSRVSKADVFEEWVARLEYTITAERDRYKAERDALQAEVAELEEENDHLQDCWFRDETICPDGSLRPKVSDLLNRIAKLEAYVAELEAEKRGEK